MGLDMYLSKHVYVKNWDHTRPSERHEITVKKGGELVDKRVIDPEKISYLIQEVGYWRKANAIHAWFVEHVQEGEDDCKEYYVDHKQLQELLETVRKVLASIHLVDGQIRNGYTITPEGERKYIMEDGQYVEDPSIAQKLLPTQSGFFFGGTEYDQYYVDDLKDTERILEEALADPDGSYYYRSSW